MTLISRDLDRSLDLFVPTFFFINLDVLDIPDHFWKKKCFPLIRGSGLRFFWGKIFFRPHDLFVPHTLFVILHILDIPDKFGVNIFFLKKGFDLEKFVTIIFSRFLRARRRQRGYFIIDYYFDIQEQFSIQKFPIRDVLNIKIFGAFCGL